jgi:hypothetical protein
MDAPMSDLPHDRPRSRSCCRNTLIASAVGLLVLVAVPGYYLAAWVRPEPRVSTLPQPAAESDAPDHPVLLMHVKFNAPDFTRLLHETAGARGIMLTALLPYEATLVANPDAAATAVDAVLTISAPRSAAALQVLLRPYVNQPMPNGYTLREVVMAQPGVLTVSMTGPLGDVPTEVVVREPSTSAARTAGDDDFILVSIHNDAGQWGRMVQGWIDHQPGRGASTAHWATLRAAGLGARFADSDRIEWAIDITFTTPEAAAMVRDALNDFFVTAARTDTSGLRYEHSLTAEMNVLRGTIGIAGLRDALLNTLAAGSPPDDAPS